MLVLKLNQVDGIDINNISELLHLTEAHVKKMKERLAVAAGYLAASTFCYAN